MHVDFNCMHILQRVHVSTPFEPMQQAIISQTAVFSKFGTIINIYPLQYLILLPEHDLGAVTWVSTRVTTHGH